MEVKELINLILLVILGMLSLVIVLLVVMQRSRSKIIKEKLRRQELTIAHKREALLHSVLGQEKERHRLSSELHDGILSKLNIINMQWALLESSIDGDGSSKFETINELLQKTIEDTKRISHNLLPVVLENFGLMTAIEEMREMVRINDIHLKVNSELTDADFKGELVIHFYRIIQELCNNAIKHSSCSELKLHLERSDEGYLLEFCDDGTGESSSLEENAGLGLKSIRSRLILLNGTMTVHDLNSGLKFIIKIKPQKENDIN